MHCTKPDQTWTETPMPFCGYEWLYDQCPESSRCDVDALLTYGLSLVSALHAVFGTYDVERWSYDG